MRVFAVVLALSVMLTAAPTFAQAPAPAQPAPPRPGAPAGQAPAPRPQTQTPPAPTQPAQPAAVRPPFKDGFKYAYINIQEVAATSADGKAATTEIAKLRDQRQKELTEKNKALQSAQQKLESASSLVTDAARAAQQSDIDRQQRDIERAAEDAQGDVERLTTRLQQEFMVKLQPVIERVAKEKQIDMIFNAAESGLVWAASGMDLTADVIRALDGGASKPAASAPATAPAAGACECAARECAACDCARDCACDAGRSACDPALTRGPFMFQVAGSGGRCHRSCARRWLRSNMERANTNPEPGTWQLGTLQCL